MRRRRVVPGLVVDDAMYDAVVNGLATQAPDYAVTWDEFTAPDRWWLLPDPHCVPFRAEYVLREDQEATVKVNLWLAPDLRGGQQPMPHNHPCTFASRILIGGYTEHRYEIRGSEVRTRTASHRQGDRNTMPHRVFHEIVEVDPGKTITLLVGGAGSLGDWGYLNPETGEYMQVRRDPAFIDRLRRSNPHRT